MKSLTEQKKLERTVFKLIARSWIDEEFHKRFYSDPAAMLREAGLKAGEFAQVEVIENLSPPVLRLAGAEGGNFTYEIPLPARPDGLADEQLRAWVAGMSDDSSTAPLCWIFCLITTGCCG